MGSAGYTSVWKGDYNRAHHKAKFEDAAGIFKDPDTFFWNDVEHSTEDEKRVIAFGSSGLGQVVYVVHIQHTPDHAH